jgi:hypothetical protein
MIDEDLQIGLGDGTHELVGSVVVDVDHCSLPFGLTIS